MKYDPNLVVPAEVMQAVQTVRRFAAQHDTTDDWQIGGLGPTHHLQRQLAETQAWTRSRIADLERSSADVLFLYHQVRQQLADAIRERDQYKAACELADALRPLGAAQVVEGGAVAMAPPGYFTSRPPLAGVAALAPPGYFKEKKNDN